ncbi:hypothetical protein PC116_g24519 [Phytophthora cactorum]|uniref:Uncharacterized protein n=1 Tax=Phytophthora cactorum TaxID=29920 RepID=A0A8T1JRQ5_9STRA|nr:hypothetical protein PC113_g12747 [Phytophthora cactorum]KAG2901059.1 hypothetical protein PC114_g13334 [Phytophthora cactorum]KAG3060315.1 hypothetical protein PC121_g13549 [Phytophthora cactorum]KAG4056704.1 hypothetical protein PC123_g8267 [Phytophthora cactorum]KAG4227083.1 hypothetical protein PC116_g24519 [Phytophthora cactorum]
MGPLKKKLSAEWLRDKVSTARTAKEKRIAVVMRTIRAWENISTECVIKSFEKAIPKERVVMV